MIVVSDTSAITSLSAIGHLFLLRELYATVIIPEAVYQELFGPPLSAGAREVKTHDWIEIKSLTDNIASRRLVTALKNDLDRGEAEAIALALELEANLILIDERLGREAAKQVGLQVTGVIGVLLKAKNQTLIDKIRPQLDALRSQTGFYMSNKLYERALQLADETLV